MDVNECAQCVLDIKAWFSRTKGRGGINDPASSADIQRLEKTIDIPLPRAMKVLLSEADGGLYFMDKKQLSVQDIQEFIENQQRSRKWKEGLLPFCGDDSGALVIDTEDHDCVREWDADDGLGDQVSSSLVRYLEQYRNNLLGGQFEFVDEMGVLEKMSSRPNRK